MGIFSAIKELLSGSPDPEPTPELQAEARANWERAARSGDYAEAFNAAHYLGQEAWLWDECVAALRSLYQRFEAHRGETAAMIGQSLYLGKAGYRAELSEAEQAAVYQDALAWYAQAAQHGDRSQSLNFVEMCEWLAERPSYRAALRPFLNNYRSLYPNDEYQARIDALSV
ncbi:MAG: hypothetical protein H6707_01805 [Deltaproteobacteria bacterium]|nr:hypothetical protein [Deltaproteobacteria bacterium]